MAELPSPKKKNKQKKLRVNILLNNKEAPMHDTINTCGRYTQNSCVSLIVQMHLFLKPLRLRARVSLGAFGAHTPCGPAAAHIVSSGAL